MNASQTQVKNFIEPFEACGVIVDVFLITWQPEGNLREVEEAKKKMIDVFGKRVVYQEWRAHKYTLDIKVNGQYENYAFSIKSVADYHKNFSTWYDGMLVVRSDLIIKRPLLNLPDVVWSKVLFLFHMYEQGGGYPLQGDRIEQRVPETIIWFPWKFCNCAQILGWKEHDFPFMNALAGHTSMNYFMPREYHDANTMGDPNPIYAQACRKEAMYDIHGGHAHAFFNVEEFKAPDFVLKNGQRWIEAFQLQNFPRSVPPQTMVMHAWATHRAVKEALHVNFGQVPQEEKFEPRPTKWDYLDITLSSMRKVWLLLKKNKEYAYKSAYHPRYKYDRIAWLRVDYFWKTKHFDLYVNDTSATTYVGFGAARFPEFPTIILTDHEGAWLLGKWLASNVTAPLIHALTRASVSQWLQHAIGRPVKVMCEEC